MSSINVLSSAVSQQTWKHGKILPVCPKLERNRLAFSWHLKLTKLLLDRIVIGSGVPDLGCRARKSTDRWLQININKLFKFKTGVRVTVSSPCWRLWLLYSFFLLGLLIPIIIILRHSTHQARRQSLQASLELDGLLLVTSISRQPGKKSLARRA